MIYVRKKVFSFLTKLIFLNFDFLTASHWVLSEKGFIFLAFLDMLLFFFALWALTYFFSFSIFVWIIHIHTHINTLMLRANVWEIYCVPTQNTSENIPFVFGSVVVGLLLLWTYAVTHTHAGTNTGAYRHTVHHAHALPMDAYFSELNKRREQSLSVF